jgi:uncharacterized FlaG/YvyC family protein
MSSNISASTSLPPSIDVERTRNATAENSLDVTQQKSISKLDESLGNTPDLLAHDVFAKAIDKTINENRIDAANEKSTEKQIDDAINIVAEFINQPPRNVNFTKDSDSGKTVIKVFDLESKELIKQFPSEELISIAQKIQALHQEVDEKAGIFLDKRI